MSFSVSAGTTIAVSASAPATFDASGYNALSWTSVGEMRNIPPFGASWQFASHNPLNLRGTQKKKTSRNAGSFNPTIALDTDDAGQIILKASRDSATAVTSVRVTTPNGDKYYFQIVVIGFEVSIGDQTSDQTASLASEVQCSATDVDFVEVLA